MTVSRPLAVLLLAAACASSRPPVVAVSSSQQGRPQDEQAASAAPPALFGRPPWKTTVDTQGNFVHEQSEARIRFPAAAGELARSEVEIYDEARNDVGFHYVRAPSPDEPRCLYTLSVYVYPATQPLDQHLVAVQREFLARTPQAKPSTHVLPLDRIQKDTGVHAAYTSVVDTLAAFDQISIYRRGDWFLKYRITYGPADRESCEQRLYDAIAALQIGP
jgi:hypothetical protein